MVGCAIIVAYFVAIYNTFLARFWYPVECGLYQNATAPVKGEKVSLKIHRADLIDK